MKTEHPNDNHAKPNTAEHLADATRTASVSISPSWLPTERVSDIVFVQILRFACADPIRHGHF